KQLIFVEMKMLHWPDSMACYLTKDNILFSNDAFGQHYATEFMYNDLVDQEELYTECMKYYANILTPFSAFVDKKIHEVLSLKIPIDIIATSHGVIWRDNPTQIVEKYLTWANDYQENQITILYDTMWDGTKRMAEAIIKGIREIDTKVNVKLYNIAKTDKNDLITEIFKSRIILLGSPTIGGGVLSGVAEILEMIKGMRFKNKKAAAFGCYGWSGESVKVITEHLEKSGFSIINDGIRAMWNPDEESIENCVKFGREIANS
ncbi:MAG: flavodoxin domain-containing protein, partial [Candidatus Lokiarchaeota archaeon]|nr:flavodoxin domain-containing protein [Candidatus Lokiarchaeota archaeon]